MGTVRHYFCIKLFVQVTQNLSINVIIKIKYYNQKLLWKIHNSKSMPIDPNLRNTQHKPKLYFKKVKWFKIIETLLYEIKWEISSLKLFSPKF